MISTKLQGRWRTSSWNFKMPSHASFTAPGEPGRQKMNVPPATPAQARLWIVEVPIFA